MQRSLTILFLSFLTAFFLGQSSAFGEYRELLPEKSAWTFVTVKPAKNWTTQSPLPKSQICVGEIHTDRQWPKKAPNVWMTTKLTLPKDYTPGNLLLRYRHDDNMMVFINGELVYQALGYTYSEGIVTYTRRIPNHLIPGENIIAAYVENEESDGFASVSLLEDGEPPLDWELITPPTGKWSYTYDNPGDRWVEKFPLPKSKLAFGTFNTKKLWPHNTENIWMTQVVMLPPNYVPEGMHVQFVADDFLWLYINGTLVLDKVSSFQWTTDRNMQNPLRPGKNIIAARGFNWRPGDGILGVDIFISKSSEESKKNPFENMRRPPRENEEEEDAQPQVELTEIEKQIVRAMDCFKIQQEKLAVAALEKVVAEDEKDYQANCILGTYHLLKSKKRADALKYFQKAVKANPKDPSVLNNYGVAAAENKKFDVALQAWGQLAKVENPPMELAQNIGTMLDLINKKRVAMKEAEVTRLVDLYTTVCTTQHLDHDIDLGFMLMPLKEGVGARPDCDTAFQQEMKRGKETLQGQPYELKWHAFVK